MTAEHEDFGCLDRIRHDVRSILVRVVTPGVAQELTERILSTVFLPRENIGIGRMQIIRWRDAAVRRDFNGRNHAEVMRRYSISLPTLYRVLARRERLK